MRVVSGAITLAILFVAGFAHAGIIVTRKGKVFIGKIKKEGLGKDHITMIRPRHGNGRPLDLGKTATFKFERNKIRWFDINADAPTLDYWKKFKKKPIDPGFSPPKDLTGTIGGVATDAETGLAQGTLDILRNRRQILQKRKIQRAGFAFQPPLDWERQDRGDSISVMVASNEVVGGYAARIHLFSVKRPSDQIYSLDAQLQWYEEAIKKLSIDSKINRVQKDSEELLGSSSRNITMTTLTKRDGREIIARRYLFIRKEKIYFATCYSIKEEFKRRSKLFDKFRKNLSLLDD